MTNKAELRRQVLDLRDQMDAGTRIENCLAAAQHASDKLNIVPGIIVSAFLPIRSEIDARPLMDELRKSGARLCLPIVINKTTLEFRELVRGAPMADAGFGTIGPDENATMLEPQVMIVPLAAFDKHGSRIGYGAGHYDRTIARLIATGKRPRLIGLAFDCQEVAHIEAEPHDVPLDALLSESGYREFSNSDMKEK